MICKTLRRIEDAMREWRIRRLRDRYLSAAHPSARRIFREMMLEQIRARSEAQLQRMARGILSGKRETSTSLTR